MASNVSQPSSCDFSGRRPFARKSHASRASALVHVEEWVLSAKIVLEPIHYHGLLASFPAIHFTQHPPPALSAMPVRQNLPLYRLLGLPEDE